MSESPFAHGAHGNVVAGASVAHLYATGHDTGVDQNRLTEAVRLAREAVTHSPATGSSGPAGR